MMRKSKFVHEAEAGGYRCPEGHRLTYATTDRNGCKHYTSDPAVCGTCPLLASCTSSGKAIYKRRKKTVERSFAGAKQLH